MYGHLALLSSWLSGGAGNGACGCNKEAIFVLVIGLVIVIGMNVGIKLIRWKGELERGHVISCFSCIFLIWMTPMFLCNFSWNIESYSSGMSPNEH